MKRLQPAQTTVMCPSGNVEMSEVTSWCSVVNQSGSRGSLFTSSQLTILTTVNRGHRLQSYGLLAAYNTYNNNIIIINSLLPVVRNNIFH